MSRPKARNPIEDVLLNHERVVWSAFRSAQRRNDIAGSRRRAVELVARRQGRDAGEVATQIEDIRTRLVAAGLIKPFQFFLTHRPELPTGRRWKVESFHEGLKDFTELTAGLERFGSVRFALNAALAGNLADVLTFDDAIALAAEIKAEAELHISGQTVPTKEPVSRVSTFEDYLGSGISGVSVRKVRIAVPVELRSLRFVDYFLFSPGQAAWVADRIEKLVGPEDPNDETRNNLS
jgi:hypothetical protein